MSVYVSPTSMMTAWPLAQGEDRAEGWLPPASRQPRRGPGLASSVQDVGEPGPPPTGPGLTPCHHPGCCVALAYSPCQSGPQLTQTGRRE